MQAVHGSPPHRRLVGPGSRKLPSETGGPLKTANSGGFRFTETSENGVVVIRGSVQWIALVVVLGILGICARWWLIHRRAWNPHSRSNEDEAMRRHVNRNYD